MIECKGKLTYFSKGKPITINIVGIKYTCGLIDVSCQYDSGEYLKLCYDTEYEKWYKYVNNPEEPYGPLCESFDNEVDCEYVLRIH